MEFTDLEMSDLLNDLHVIGASEFCVITPGKDYGFGSDLKGENDGKTVLYFTEEALKKVSHYSTISLPWSNWEEYEGWWERDKVFVPTIHQKIIFRGFEGTSDKDKVIYGISLSGVSEGSRVTKKIGAGFPSGVKFFDIGPEDVKKWYDIIVKNARKDSMKEKKQVRIFT